MNFTETTSYRCAEAGSSGGSRVKTLIRRNSRTDTVTIRCRVAVSLYTALERGVRTRYRKYMLPCRKDSAVELRRSRHRTPRSFRDASAMCKKASGYRSHTSGLLNGWFQPPDEIRMLPKHWRQRANHLRAAVTRIQRMQKPDTDEPAIGRSGEIANASSAVNFRNLCQRRKALSPSH